MVAKSEVTAVDLRRGAMDLLARREHSRQELQNKLGRRFDVEPERISTVVEQLAQEGLQSNSFKKITAHVKKHFSGGVGGEGIREARKKETTKEIKRK